MRLTRAVLFPAACIAACLLLVWIVAVRGVIVVRAADRTAPAFARPQTAAAPTIQVYSRETVVDVTVTDAKGNPVHGLTRDNFTVKEDGKGQSIKSFAEFGAGAPQPLPKLPPHVYSNLEPPAPSGATNIVLLDFLNLAALPDFTLPGAPDTFSRSMAAQKAVKREAQKYVASMPAGTRVMVLGLSSNLRTLQGLTSDPVLLSAALDTFDYNTKGQVSTYQEFCVQAELRVRMTLEALNQIAADVAPIKGKKNLLWFSVGIPWLTDPSARAECLPDYAADLSKTYGLLAAGEIAVYPIDARGVPNMPATFITSTGALWVNVYASQRYPEALRAYLADNAEQELSMESIAEATGGAAYYNSYDLAGLLGKAVSHASDYYSLSYVPPGAGYNNAHHRIKVEVDKPGLHLVYRPYYDAVDPAKIKPASGLTLAAAPANDPATPVDMRTEMARAMPTATGILFDVQVEPSTEPAKPTDPQVIGALDTNLKSKPLTRYGFTYAFPGSQIVFHSAADGTRHGSLEFDLAAYDGEGNVVTSLRQAIDLNLTADQVAQLEHSPFRYFQQLDLPPGALFVRIGVLDRTSNKVGTLEVPVTVAKPEPQHASQNTSSKP